MNYTVIVSPRAVRDRRRLPGDIRQRADAAMVALASNPRPHGCLKMTNTEEWRIRVGQYRVCYLIDDRARRVNVTRIGHRRSVYDP